jgi:hypothetical protein
MNLQKETQEIFFEELKNGYKRMFNEVDSPNADFIVWTAKLALEIISKTNALYHNMDHIIVVALAGLAIIEGKQIQERDVSKMDWVHFMVALLCHDIGYFKGACKADVKENYATGIGSNMVHVPRGGTDVTLTPYHVDRGKLFVQERFQPELLQNEFVNIDINMVVSYTERTRFPIPEKPAYKITNDFAGLVRTADLIGQLGDVNYVRKISALYYEFEELVTNDNLGYSSPTDMQDSYSDFYRGRVYPYIQDGVQYLRQILKMENNGLRT